MNSRIGVCSTSGRGVLPSLLQVSPSLIRSRRLCKHSGCAQLQDAQLPRPSAHLPTHGRGTALCRAAAASNSDGEATSVNPEDFVYPLEKTKIMVETAMLAAVSGLAYLLSTLLRLETSLGYFLPLPVALAALRSGAGAGWRTMFATATLVVVLLGPLRAVSYVLIHGLTAATLGTLWANQANFWLTAVVGGLVRMAGQIAYLVLSSVTMNENLFAIMLSNVYGMLDQISASIGHSGAPSPTAISSMLFALVLVNSLCYVFLLQVVYRIMLTSMGYRLGPLPSLIRKYLYAGMPDPEAATAKYG
mmetsp:Transcript_37814/g.95640  ORF Transcript_37814/g.95640 Transcript_37814/m.95640 type:complete len:304 (-) Transcript_37814:261-1172(-)